MDTLLNIRNSGGYGLALVLMPKWYLSAPSLEPTPLTRLDCASLIATSTSNRYASDPEVLQLGQTGGEDVHHRLCSADVPGDVYSSLHPWPWGCLRSAENICDVGVAVQRSYEVFKDQGS